MTTPNPQGKGLVPVLNDIAYSWTRIDVPPKKIDQVAGELFTSMFVLESEFSFRPVVGKGYYLFQKDGRFRMSLVGPEQWGDGLFGRFIGRCVLGRDMSWTLEMDEGAAGDRELNRYIEKKKQAFEKTLESAERLGDTLPVYCESFPYYQRLFASALANSLGISMRLSGIMELTYHEAMGLLENTK